MNREVGVITKERKTRNDKKRDVKPTISADLKNCIYRLAYVTNKPVKDVVATICEKGLHERSVLEYLSKYFRREFKFMNTLYLGDLERESLQKKYQSGKNERVTTRFNQNTFETLNALSNALDVTPTKATALLLDASIRNTNLLNNFVKEYLHSNIDDNRMKELRLVLKYINKNNPYNEEISWFALLSLIFDEIKENTQNVRQTINKWLDRYK